MNSAELAQDCHFDDGCLRKVERPRHHEYVVGLEKSNLGHCDMNRSRILKVILFR
jgi:hypothetical protein